MGRLTSPSQFLIKCLLWSFNPLHHFPLIWMVYFLSAAINGTDLFMTFPLAHTIYSNGPDLFIQKATVRGRTIWKPKIEFNSVILETLTSFEKKFKTANSIFCLINQRSYIAFASYFLLFSWHHIPISHRFASIIFKVVLLSWTISSHGLCISYNQSLEKGNIRDHCILYLFLLQFLYFLRCFSCFDCFVRCFLSLFSFWCGLRSSFEAY